MITLGRSFHFFALFVCKAAYANCLFLSAPVVCFFSFTLQLKMNAELPETVVQMFKLVLVHCLITPEGSKLLIHLLPTQRHIYKEEKIPFYYLQYEKYNTFLTHNNTAQFILQDKWHWNQRAQHEHYHSLELVN